MDEQLSKELDALLHEVQHLTHHAGAAAEDPPLLHGPQAQQPPPPLIVYLVDAPPAEAYEDYDYDPDAQTVESLPETEEAPPPSPTVDEAESEMQAPHSAPRQQDIPTSSTGHHPRRKSKRGVLVGILCLLLAGAALLAFLSTPLSASAIVTIIPQSRVISGSSTLTVVTAGTVNPLHHELAGRVLSSLTLSQAQTVPTTGTGHQEARAAQGTVTFYNASLAMQTVTAGTLLVGSDGMQVVTDQEAVIPAGSLSTNGQVSVPAHAVQAGPAGNIAAEDLYGPCCRLDVFVQNRSAFHGGQDARSFPMVSQRDLNGTVSLLGTSLLHSVQAAFAAQVQPGESLLTPHCTPTITATHAVGEEATSLDVTLDESCTAVAYSTQALHDLLTQVLTQEASRRLTAGYHLSSEVQASVIGSSGSYQQPGRITLLTQGMGTWSYQFSEAALEQLATRIVGKSPREAKTILLGMPGVQSVSIQLSGGIGNSPLLPGNPTQIQMEQLLSFGQTWRAGNEERPGSSSHEAAQANLSGHITASHQSRDPYPFA